MAINMSRQKSDFLLLASLFLLELAIAVVPMAIYMKGHRPFGVFFSSRLGAVFLLAVAGIAAAGAVIVKQSLVYRRSRSGHFPMVVTMNLVTVMLILVTGEIAI